MFCISVILGILIKCKETITKAVDDDCLIKTCHLETRPEKIPMKILDEKINLYRVRKYFTLDCWKKVEKLLETLKQERSWECATCCKVLGQKPPRQTPPDKNPLAKTPPDKTPPEKTYEHKIYCT